MSHYYAQATGSARTDATRRGFKSSGISARADSWSIGGRVSIRWCPIKQTDIVTIYQTRGSDSSGSAIMSYAIIDDKFTVLDTHYPELLL